MLDKTKPYLLRYFINNKLIYHKLLRYTHTKDENYIFADLTSKGGFIIIKASEYPTHSWAENASEHTREICGA